MKAKRTFLQRTCCYLVNISVFVALLAVGLQAGEIHDAVARGQLNKVQPLLEADATLLESKDASPEAGLANGHLNPGELAGQKVTVLITKRAGSANESSLLELAKGLPGAEFVTCSKPDSGLDGSVTPRHHLAAANRSFRIGDLQVHAIPATGSTFTEVEAGGVGYLVDADGVRIFHAGFHSSRNQTEQLERYRKEIDLLRPFGPIDVAMLPVNGHISVDYQPYLYLLNQLSPKAVYLIGDDLTKEEHRKCTEVLRARNVPVFYPEGGIAVGERLHYLPNPSVPSLHPARNSRQESAK